MKIPKPVWQELRASRCRVSGLRFSGSGLGYIGAMSYSLNSELLKGAYIGDCIGD